VPGYFDFLVLAFLGFEFELEVEVFEVWQPVRRVRDEPIVVDVGLGCLTNCVL
jgi:hypothetical protein